MGAHIRHRSPLSGAAVVLLCLPLLAAPAAAAAGELQPSPGRPAVSSAQQYWFRVSPHDVSLGLPGAPGKRVTASVAGYTVDPRVTIDVSGLAGVAEVRSVDSRCAPSGAKAVCRLPSLERFTDELVLFLIPAAQAEPGDQGTIIWDQWPPAVLPGPGDDTHEVLRWTSRVTIADGGDLVVTPLGPLPTAAVGSRVTIPLTVTNAGNQPIDNLYVIIRLTHGLRPASYANCRTQPYDPPYSNSSDTICGIPGVLEPATTYHTSFEATVEAFASRWQQVSESVYPGDGAVVRGPMNAPDLALTAREFTAAGDEIDSHDNHTDAQLLVDTGLDLAAIGATIVGDPGDVVTARVGLRNVGPSEIDPTDGLTFVVRPPAGVEVTSAPCQRNDDGRYTCGVDQWLFGPGVQVVEFRMRIAAAPGADGSVQVAYRGGPARDVVVDDDPANDIAAIRIASRAGGLPITGTWTRPVALTGVAALLLGVLAVLISRPPRRRGS